MSKTDKVKGEEATTVVEPKQETKPKTVVKRIFKPIDITNAIKKAKTVPKKEAKKGKKYKSSFAKEKDDYTIVSISDRQLIEAHESSIQKYLNECHPDIKTFIESNEIKKLTAAPGTLTVVTKNNFRVVIKTTSANEKHVKITDAKKKVLFDAKTVVNFVRQKVA